MAASKIKQVWYCTSCGNEYAKWMGRCPACGECGDRGARLDVPSAPAH